MDQQEGQIKGRAQENMPAFEAVWTDNAEGLPQADVVIIRPGESANRRFYSKEAIQDAVNRDFWGGTPMFINHGDQAMPRKRKLEDLRAKIEKGSTYVGAEGEARGKVSFFDPAFASFARAAQESMGLSAVHEFAGQRYRGSDRHYHERVDKFLTSISVDFVAFPAAGGQIAQFLPAQESEDDVDFGALTPEMLREHQDELTPELKALLAAESDGGDTVPDPAPVPEPPPAPEPPPPAGYMKVETIKTFVQEQVEAAVSAIEVKNSKQIETRQAVIAHVNKSGLPEKTRTRIASEFDGSIEYDRKAVQESIDSAVAEAKSFGWAGPKVVGLGDSMAQESSDTLPDADTVAKRYPAMAAVDKAMAYKPRAGKAN